MLRQRDHNAHYFMCRTIWYKLFTPPGGSATFIVNQGPVTSYRKFRGIPCEDPYIALIFGMLLGSSAAKPRNKFQNNLK